MPTDFKQWWSSLPQSVKLVLIGWMVMFGILSLVFNLGRLFF